MLSSVKRKIKYNDYNQVLETNEVILRAFNSNWSKKHTVYSINIIETLSSRAFFEGHKLAVYFVSFW